MSQTVSLNPRVAKQCLPERLKSTMERSVKDGGRSLTDGIHISCVFNNAKLFFVISIRYITGHGK